MRENLVADLKTLRDEARVRLHLAGMDARDAWRELEPNLTAIERDLAAARDGAQARAREVIAAARKILGG